MQYGKCVFMLQSVDAVRFHRLPCMLAGTLNVLFLSDAFSHGNEAWHTVRYTTKEFKCGIPCVVQTVVRSVTLMTGTGTVK